MSDPIVLKDARLEICCSRQFLSELRHVARQREQSVSGLVRQIAIEHLPLQLNK